MRELAGVRVVDRPDAWTRFVEGHPQAGFLQSWRWGDLKARYGWRPHRLVAPAQGPIEAAVQILVRTRAISPFGHRVGVAYVPRGPLADSPDHRLALIRATADVARDAGASFVRVEPPSAAAVDALESVGFRRTSRFIQIPRTAVVDLGPDEDRILAGFKSKLRYNIRLAARRGVEVVEAASDEDFEAFMQLARATAARERFAIHAPAYYRDVWDAFRPDDAALIIARLAGEPLAAVMVVRAGGIAVYLYGASSDRHRNRMAPHAAQWAAIRWARSRGCRTYDLWGMADAASQADPLAGVHRFKLGFNPRIVEYPGAFDLPLQRLRAWSLDQGLLRGRDLLNRWLRRPRRAAGDV